MKQVKLSVVLFKNTVMIGIAFCAIPFFGSVHAQTSGSQTQVLFEMQTLRQEVAELRDMVERQQYEMRKLQRQLQNNNATTPAKPVSSGVEVLELNRSPVVSSNTSVLNGSTVPSVVTQPGVSAPQVTGNSLPVTIANPVVVSTEQLNTAVTTSAPSITSIEPVVGETADSREYPPVVEIAIGSAESVSEGSVNPLQSSTVGAIDASVVPVAPVDRTITLPNTSANSQSVLSSGGSLSTGASSVISQGANIVNERVVEPSLTPIDIKPIETIRSEPLVSIPQPVQTASIATPVAPTVLDPSSVVPVVSEGDYYQQGFALLKESKHDEAVAVFKKQISSYPKGDQADDAYYWIAESSYVNRKLDISKENFKAIIQSYPKSERLPDAMLKLAYIEQEQGNIIEARILLQEILQFHPKSDAALSAKNRLAEIK